MLIGSFEVKTKTGLYKFSLPPQITKSSNEKAFFYKTRNQNRNFKRIARQDSRQLVPNSYRPEMSET